VTDRRDDDQADDVEPEPARPGPTATEGVRILGAKEAQAALDGGQVARRLGGDTPRFGDVPPRPDPSVRPAARFPRPVVDEDAETEIDDVVPEAPQPRPREITGRSQELELESDFGDLEAALSVVEDDDDDAKFRGEVSAIVAETNASDRAAADQLAPDQLVGEPLVIDVSEEGSGPAPLPHWTEPPTGEVPIILPESETIDDPDAEADLDSWSAASTGAPRFRSGAGDWADADFSDPEGLKDDEPALGALAPKADDDAEFDKSVAQRRRRRLRIRTDGPTTSADDPVTPIAAAGSAGVVASTSGADADTGELTRPQTTEPGSKPTRRVEPEGPGGAGVALPPGSDLLTRVIVGVVLAIAALICLNFGRGSTAVLATVVVGVAAFEFYEALRKRGFHPATILGLLAAVTTPLAAYKVGESAFPLMLALLTVFSLLWYLFDVVEARVVVSAAVTVFGYAYIGVLGGFAGLLLVSPNGVGLILGVVLCAVAYDIFGYLVGSWLGKTPLMEKVSPNKTLEGLLGGMTASIVVAAVVVNRITPWTDLGHALSLGVVVAIVAPLGDLCESLLKRDLKIKDFGTLLPGHGGVLDRFDAILFCLPAVYYLARYLKIG
jgi:phosphatidate cytidylyltransferase